MHGKTPQCMETVVVPICKNNNGDVGMNVGKEGKVRPRLPSILNFFTLLVTC